MIIYLNIKILIKDDLFKITRELQEIMKSYKDDILYAEMIPETLNLNFIILQINPTIKERLFQDFKDLMKCYDTRATLQEITYFTNETKPKPIVDFENSFISKYIN